MGFRSFTGGFFSFLVIFVGINALIWFGWTRDITDPHRNSGDLLRIGYILGYESPHQNVDDLPRRHIRANEYKKQPVDMVTVGDSFSIGGGGGRNSHYQDYIASLQGLTVSERTSCGEFRKYRWICTGFSIVTADQQRLSGYHQAEVRLA